MAEDSGSLPDGSLREHACVDATELAANLALAVADVLRAAIATRGAAFFAVSGGRSPAEFLRLLVKQSLDWTAVTVTLVDERWVDPSSADSNERLLRETLLAGTAGITLIPLKRDTVVADDSVGPLQRDLADLPLPFDVIVLGMGDDGHTASLFPGAVGIEAAMDPDAGALVVAIQPPAAAHQRMSLTLRALLHSRHLFLQFQGKAKMLVYRRARAGASPFELPIAAVLNQNKVPVDVYWAH